MDTPTPAELERVGAARDHAHRTTCPTRHLPGPCPACPTATGVLLALRHLDAHPRDARGARQALHGVVCRSGCSPDDTDHADRTQSKTAAALRKFRALHP